MPDRLVESPFCFELAEGSFGGVVMEGEVVEGRKQMSFAELLLVELVLDLAHAVALFDFLHET